MSLNLQTCNLPAIQHHHPILSHADGQGGMLGDGCGEERGTLATHEGRAACEPCARARWVRGVSARMGVVSMGTASMISMKAHVLSWTNTTNNGVLPMPPCLLVWMNGMVTRMNRKLSKMRPGTLDIK